jgi:excisionase family DNA binding protein
LQNQTAERPEYVAFRLLWRNENAPFRLLWAVSWPVGPLPSENERRNMPNEIEMPVVTCGDYLSENEAAEILSVEGRTIRNWMNERGLPHFRITSKVVRIKRTDLVRWIESHRAPAPA